MTVMLLDSITASPHTDGVGNSNTFHAFLSIQSRGVLALPPEVRKRLGLDVPGAQVEVTERADGVIELRPQIPVPTSQAWFWTEAWQAREREVNDELVAGRVTTYADGESFLESLSD
jgi:antitoxin MazE